MVYANLSPSNNPLVTSPVHKSETLVQSTKTAPTTSTIELADKPPPPPRSPVLYLKEMFARNEYGIRLLASQLDNMSFARPSKEATEAYDLTVVQAIRLNDLEKLSAMLHDGKSFNACNRFGESLVHMVCRRGNIEMANFLITEASVDVDVRDDFGRTPMHDACWTSKPNLAMMDLLINNVPPQMLLSEDVRGHTPFDYARQEHYDEWTEYLRSKEEDIQMRITTYGMIW
jgi:ankyrin repeat protein